MVPPHRPDSNFLDHVLTRTCNAVMRKKDLWVWSGAEKSIKETCEIYGRPPCFSSLEPSQHAHSCATPWTFSATHRGSPQVWYRSVLMHMSPPLFSSAGPPLLCDGICEWRRSDVPHSEVQEVWRAESLFLHGRDHVCSHVPAQQGNHLQVWISEHNQ